MTFEYELSSECLLSLSQLYVYLAILTVSFSQVYQTHADKKCAEAESIFATVPQEDLRFQQKFQGLEIFFQKPLRDGCNKR